MKRNTRFLRIFALLISVLILYSAFTVFSATYVEDGDWKYEVTQTGDEYYLGGYLGSSTKVRIPALFQTKPVTKINNNAFLNESDIVYVEIPHTIKEIGMNAFYGCTDLTSVEIPSSVELIGANAFYGCKKVTKITINNNTGLKDIPRNCFANCSSVTQVSIAYGVETIGDKAFLNCSSLESIVIPTSITYISDTAFKNCDSLKIVGWNGTYAQTYASENNLTFVSLGDYEEPTEPDTTVDTDPAESTTATDDICTSSSVPTTSVDSTPAISESTDPVESSSGDSGLQKYLIGDTDLSGNVTVKDATLIQKYAASLVQLNKTQLFLANCNGQGDVNVKDATQIQKYCAGFINILFVGTEVEL